MVTAGAGTQPIAQWYSVRDGRIASLRVIVDARPFAALREGQG
jgi:ketosteroid isomerase-like protein